MHHITKKITNSYQKVFAGYFGLLFILWVYIQITGTKTSDVNFAYSFLFGLIPLFGGLIGLFKSNLWGGIKTILGKAIFFFSTGLLLWGLGEMVWSYYNFFMDEPAPYPSLADIGFAPSIFFWILGAYYLAKASGAYLAFRRSNLAKFLTVFILAVITAAAYVMLIQVARKGVLVPEGETALKTVLDIAYPLGDFLALCFALIVFVLGRKYLGGFYKGAIGFILLGLGVMYFADFVFSYTTTAGTFYNANWGDLMLSTGTFLMSFGILGFATTPSSRKSLKES
jgi:hypothetical protein